MALRLPRFWKQRATPSSHTFAATTLNARPITMGMQAPRTGGQWQAKAWGYYDVVPEVRQVVGNRADTIAKVIIRVGRMGEDGKPEIVNDPQSNEFLDWLYGGRQHHGAHLKLLTQHLTVAGESFLVIVDGQRDAFGQETSKTQWYTLAPSCIDTAHMGGPQGHVTIKDPSTGLPVRFHASDDPNAPGTRVIRIWIPHPDMQWEADSPMRGAISILSTVTYLNASVKSAAKSRLIGGGIYPIPVEAQLPQPTTNDPAGITAVDKFRNDVYETSSTAISDPDSAAAQVPIFIHVPAEAIKVMPSKPIDFSTTFDERLPELLDKYLYRFAQGMPMPTGKIDASESNQNHWNKSQDKDEQLQVDIMPLTDLELGALTSHIVQPLLGDDKFLIPDYTAIVTPPDRTAQAIEMWNAGIIDIKEAREMSGFPEEFDRELLKQITNGPAVADPEPTIKVTSERVTAPERKTEPDPEPGQFSVAVVVDKLLVNDLLRETGKKMLTSAPRSQRGEIKDVPEEQRCQQFEGAFAAFQQAAPSVLARYMGVLTKEQRSAGVRAAFECLRHD